MEELEVQHKNKVFIKLSLKIKENKTEILNTNAFILYAYHVLMYPLIYINIMYLKNRFLKILQNKIPTLARASA